MERGDPTLYYGTKQLYFGHINFKFTGGGNHPLLRKTCYKKRLRKTRDISSTLSAMAALLGNVVNLLQHDNPMDDIIGTTTDAVPMVLAEETPTNIDTAVPTTGQMNAVPTVPTGKSSTNVDTAVP